MIELSIRLHKDDLRLLPAFVGKTNLDNFELSGAVCAAGSLCFCGFAGCHVGDQVYEGVYRFAPAPKGEMVRGTVFANLPSGLSANTKLTQESEVPHGVHTDNYAASNDSRRAD